ncbi:lysophospholipase-like protein 1 isoform X3 [Pseudomyrmex gracilis]|uniref:lysophospholipase-like protein 1 isoform X3 n=1 Tax=Pseudomyrmex gracilis TaxID=219809 RepID=UPI0009955B41|nr:lysophospholipase-like protein 1 isoform X3 [Pseudomyrmex gracilis]
MASKIFGSISQIDIVQATRKHTATVFFLHGSGGTGDDLKKWIHILNRGKLQFPHIKLIYPTAPSQPYTPSRGMIQNVWFDRAAISNQVPEDVKSIDSMCQNISELIDKEVFDGIPLNRIIHLKISPEDSKVPFVQYHGMTDTLVDFEWGEETAKSLIDLGVNVKFVPLKSDHELTQEEILNWKCWLLDILPDK